jgi:DnaJ domain
VSVADHKIVSCRFPLTSEAIVECLVVGDKTVIDDGVLTRKSEGQMEVWEYRNHYELLEVPRTAASEEIKRAFRLQAQAWFPDKFPSAMRDIVQSRAKKINEAYAELNSAARRKAYDATLPPEDVELDAFPEPIQNVPGIWKRLAAWMKDEDVGTPYMRRMAFSAGNLLERRRVPSERQIPYMLEAWEKACSEGFDPIPDDNE